MSNHLSRNQILKAGGAFIAGAAAAKGLPLVVGNEPAQAQSCPQSICASNAGSDFNLPQISIVATSDLQFARLRFKESFRPIWDIAVGGELNQMNFFAQNIGNVMTLRTNGNLSIKGTLTQGSSRTLKENITELSSKEALETLVNLNPVKFSYKADQEKANHIGFIAEDVPDLVAVPDRKGLNAMDIVGVLTKAVQEQQKTILALTEKVAALEAKNRVS